MTQYETVFILTPVLSETQMEEAVNAIYTLIENKGGKILHKENWGLKKLAYPIQNKRNGFYHLIQFKTDNHDLISILELNYKRNEKIIRFLTTKMDKHAIEWAEKRINRKIQNK